MGMAGFVVLALALLAASTLVVSNRYATTQTATRSFTLPDDFTNVRRILMRTDATRQITDRAGDSEFLDEEWTKLGGGLESINILKPDWRLVLNANLRVHSLDEYIGKPVVTLKQVVTISPNEVLSAIKLDEGSDRLLQYELVTHYVRDEKEKNTRVELKLTEEIVTIAPWFAHRIADNRVRRSVALALEHQERAIRELNKENQSKGRLLRRR